MDGENAHSEIKLNWMGILANGEIEIRWDGMCMFSSDRELSQITRDWENRMRE